MSNQEEIAGLSRGSKLALLVVSLAAFVALYFGWRLFWFLTDDAFIGFRYISNSRLGFGYVWNAPPFRPVEGYTSFLWIALLDLVWRITGIDPPRTSNWLSLFFAALTLGVGGLMVIKLRLNERLQGHRVLLLGLVLVGVLTNRTFLAWASSGLETAMFNFFLTLWVYCALFVPTYSSRWVLAISLAVSLLTLTRPDGLLFVVITVALIIVALWRSPRKRWPRIFACAIPLLLVPGHVLWRRFYYRAWLPNTYYAKTVPGRFWLESGIRYFLSFVLEYSLWLWLLVLIIVILANHRRLKSWRAMISDHLVTLVVCLTVLGQVFYYVVVVGGDHFEYRVFSHLILLLFVVFVWLIDKLSLKLRTAVLLFVGFIALSWPIPWTHWYATHNLYGRQRTVVMRVSVAKSCERAIPALPKLFLIYPRAFDTLQSWLIEHMVCVRHQEHKDFYVHLRDTLPTREDGLKLPPSDYPVIAAGSTGVISWVLPRVNVIDVLGFNDYVVARNPHTSVPIQMAHERQPPFGYEQCFLPNVSLRDRQVTVTTRETPLTSEMISNCERRYESMLKTPEKLMAPPAESATVGSSANPIDDPHFFITQQYRDLLNREPDPDGLNYWAGHLRPCPNELRCFADNRAAIPTIFFDVSEFHEQAFFIYRLYAAAFGQAPHYAEFARDQQQLGLTRLDARDPVETIPAQRSFIENWIRFDGFRARYPDRLGPEDFVNRLYDTAELRPFIAERARHVEALTSGTTRAEILRQVVEESQFQQSQKLRGLIELQFLLQLHQDVPYTDLRYGLWLNKLRINETVEPGRVICLILTSEEYQRRFGNVITHSQKDCE